MTLPQWHGFVDPVLRIMSDSRIRRNAEIRTAVAERTRLSEEDMAEVMSSGEARWANRINWAVFDSMKAGLLVREARGQYKISDEGLRRVSSAAHITYQSLMEYDVVPRVPEYIEDTQEDGPSRRGTGNIGLRSCTSPRTLPRPSSSPRINSTKWSSTRFTAISSSSHLTPSSVSFLSL